MNKFIDSSNCYILIFTTEDYLDSIPKLDRVFPVVLPIKEWESNMLASDDEYNVQIKLYENTVGKQGISIDLIKLYHEKYNFVNRAIKLFPNYTYYVWTDIGLIQDTFMNTNLYRVIKTYPTIKVGNIIKDSICFTLRRAILKNIYDCGISDEKCSQTSYIVGGMIVGNKVAWSKFKELYNTSFQHFRDNSLFWASDEHIYLHMLCKNPNDITALEIFRKHSYSAIPCIGHNWNTGTLLLTESYPGEIHFFKPPVERPQGFPNVRKALWFSESKSLDVTDTIRNIKESGPIELMHTIFTEDPQPYYPKLLYVEYDDDRQQLIQEGDVFSPFLPYTDNGPDPRTSYV